MEKTKKLTKKDYQNIAREITYIYIDTYLYIEKIKKDREVFRAYLHYELFTPWYIKIWHKLIRKKVPTWQT